VERDVADGSVRKRCIRYDPRAIPILAGTSLTTSFEHQRTRNLDRIGLLRDERRESEHVDEQDEHGLEWACHVRGQTVFCSGRGVGGFGRVTRRAGDVRIEIDHVLQEPSPGAAAAPKVRFGRRAWLQKTSIGAVTALVAGVAAWTLKPGSDTESIVGRPAERLGAAR
jgi:hypothetical protein